MELVVGQLANILQSGGSGWQIAIILSVLFAGSFVHALTGFGFALVTMGVLSMYFSVKGSTLITIAVNGVLTVPMVIKYYRYVKLKEMSLVYVGAFMGNAFAYWFLASFGEALWLKKWLGVVLIGLVVLMWLSKRQQWSSASFQHPLSVLGICWVGGFIGSVFAVGGPFFAMYFLVKFKDKREYSVNLQVLFFLLIVTTVGMHGAGGGLDAAFWFYLLAGTPFVLLGAQLGMRWFEKVRREWIERLAQVIIIVSGLQLLLFEG